MPLLWPRRNLSIKSKMQWSHLNYTDISSTVERITYPWPACKQFRVIACPQVGHIGRREISLPTLSLISPKDQWVHFPTQWSIRLHRNCNVPLPYGWRHHDRQHFCALPILEPQPNALPLNRTCISIAPVSEVMSYHKIKALLTILQPSICVYLQPPFPPNRTFPLSPIQQTTFPPQCPIYYIWSPLVPYIFLLGLTCNINGFLILPLPNRLLLTTQPWHHSNLTNASSFD